MSVSLILLSLSLFTWGIGEGMFLLFQPIYLEELGATAMTTAGIYSAFGAAMMVAHIPAGHLADRLGRKPLLIVAWTCGLIATWGMAFARTLPLFVVAMLLYGVTAGVSSPLNSYVTSASGKRTPARLMTLMSAAYNFGAVLGPLAGGWIGSHTGLRSVYFIAAILFVISTAILLFIKSQPLDRHEAGAPPRSLLANPRFLGFLALILVVIFTAYLPQPLTSRFLENERSVTISQIGLLGAFNGLGNALFNLFLGQFTPRLGLLLTQVCVIAFTLLIWRGTGLGWYALGYFMLGGFRATRAFLFSITRALIHPAQMGLAYGMAETFSSLAVILAPLLAGALYTRQPVLVYPVAAGLLFFSLLVSLLFTPRTTSTAPVLPTLHPDA